MKITVNSVLVLNKDIIGVRVVVNDILKDIGLEALQGIEKKHLEGYNVSKLKSQGDLYITEEEIKSNTLIEDVSKDKVICSKVSKYLIQVKEGAGKKETVKKQRLFEVVVQVELFDSVNKVPEVKQFTSQFEAMNALKARAEAKNRYSQDLGVDKSEIKIIKATLVEEV